MSTNAKWLIIFVVILLLSCSTLLLAIPEDTEPIVVSRQAGFVIEVDNKIMELACSYHNIDTDGIIWDTVNDDFVFYRGEEKCFVFTNGLKEYLRKILTPLSG